MKRRRQVENGLDAGLLIFWIVVGIIILYAKVKTGLAFDPFSGLAPH